MDTPEEIGAAVTRLAAWRDGLRGCRKIVVEATDGGYRVRVRYQDDPDGDEACVTRPSLAEAADVALRMMRAARNEPATTLPAVSMVDFDIRTTLPTIVNLPPASVRCTLSHWLDHGPELVRQAPNLTLVELTDREPYTRAGRWYFHDSREAEDGISFRVLRQLDPAGTTYPTADDARRALSAALIAWARSTPPEA